MTPDPLSGSPDPAFAAVTAELLESLRLLSVLTCLSDGLLTAPQAEAELRHQNEAHHVADPEGLIGIDPLKASPIRLALGRLAHDEPRRWQLCLPRPGRMSGLRGPLNATALALDSGAIIVESGGGMAWLPQPVGAGMQWLLTKAERPVPPLTPAEASRELSEAVIAAAASLAKLGFTAGDRPDSALSVRLGPSYGERNQQLLDRAMAVLTVTDAGLNGSAEIVTSYTVLERERELRSLRDVALDAICSAMSWPAGPQR